MAIREDAVRHRRCPCDLDALSHVGEGSRRAGATRHSEEELPSSREQARQLHRRKGRCACDRERPAEGRCASDRQIVREGPRPAGHTRAGDADRSRECARA